MTVRVLFSGGVVLIFPFARLICSGGSFDGHKKPFDEGNFSLGRSVDNESDNQGGRF